MIFDKLRTKADLTTISNCSQGFRRILMDRRVYFLFPRVLDLLTSRNREIPQDDKENLTLIPFVSKGDVLICRRVCSNWNTAVEDFYNQPVIPGVFSFMLDHRMFYSEVFTPYESVKTFNPFIISCTLEVKTFVAQFISGTQTKRKNPFLGRLVVFYIEERNGEDNEFLNGMAKILDTFGHEILHVMIFHNQVTDSTGAQNYLKLRNWLKRMPNIFPLRLRFLSCDYVEDITINNNSLPELPNLVHLDVCNASMNVLAAMFKKYKISALHIEGWTDDNHWPVHLFANLFENVKKVYLRGYQEAYSKLLDLVGNCSKIETLFVYNRDPVINFSKLFLSIENHSEISDLTLVFKGREVNNFNRAQIYELNLPKLRRLQLIVDERLNIDFVQTLPNLEMLDLLLYTNNLDEVDNLQLQMKNKIQFFGFLKQMQVSNIWNVLSKLKVVKIKLTCKNPTSCYVYQRENSGAIVRKSFLLDEVYEAQLRSIYKTIYPYFNY